VSCGIEHSGSDFDHVTFTLTYFVIELTGFQSSDSRERCFFHSGRTRSWTEALCCFSRRPSWRVFACTYLDQGRC